MIVYYGCASQHILKKKPHNFFFEHFKEVLRVVKMIWPTAFNGYMDRNKILRLFFSCHAFYINGRMSLG